MSVALSSHSQETTQLLSKCFEYTFIDLGAFVRSLNLSHRAFSDV
jgi:hypothetical protein